MHTEISSRENNQKARTNTEKDQHVQWLSDWRKVRTEADAASDESPEQVSGYERAYSLSIMLCNTPATSPEALLAQLEWLHDDLGYYVEENVGPDLKGVFSVLKQSTRNLSK